MRIFLLWIFKDSKVMYQQVAIELDADRRYLHSALRKVMLLQSALEAIGRQPECKRRCYIYAMLLVVQSQQ